MAAEADGIVDVRTRAEFDAGHLPGATCIPVEALPMLLCALPPRDAPVPKRIEVAAQTEADAETARALIESSGYEVPAVHVGAGAVGPSRGPSRRIWSPNAFISRTIGAIESALERSGMERKAIDLACGSGRDAVFLAARGWHVRAVDTQQRLIDCAVALARHEGCAEGSVDAVVGDVTACPDSLGDGYSLVHIARFLHRPMFEAVGRIVAPGGFIAWFTFCEPSTGKPAKPKHILKHDELRDAFAGWEVVEFSESRLQDNRPVQFLCARKPTVNR